MSKQMSCFICCAFGRPEVDLIYKKSILPILKEFKILPLRVDNVTHNSNIDQKIIELIKSSDFCIADLTFARPSVYYEVGFVHGLKKEVVFTARKDHFHPKESDKLGNEKIHFDLITKNFVGWGKVNSGFDKKLRALVKLVIQPIVKRNALSESLLINEKKFSNDSLFNRIKILRDFSKSKIKLLKYQITYETNKYVIGSRPISSKERMLSIYSFDSLTYSNLLDFRDIVYRDSVMKNIYGKTKVSKIKSLILVIICLSKISKTNVHKAFKDFEITEENDIITANDPSKKTKLFIVNNIKSKDDLSKRFELLKLK